jgi:hypothetical protein
LREPRLGTAAELVEVTDSPRLWNDFGPVQVARATVEIFLRFANSRHS